MCIRDRGKNGLELLKLVKTEWPLTKAVMITAYASTDTAMKAIQMGALDYIPKPFTPDELRSTVEKALSGEIQEAPTTEKEREQIDVIDIDIPFDREEVARAAGDTYADMLGPSDMPVVEVKAREPLENFCEVGDMVCDIFKKLGATCKAGVKTASCPQKKAKKKKAATGSAAIDTRNLIGIDEPVDYQEVISVTGPEYVRNLHHDGVAFMPYEELKKNVSKLMHTEKGIIDVDMPFDYDQVAEITGEAYADKLSRSDVPVVEITASEPLENFCEVGDMVCDIFKKLGATCKAGVKTASCPQKKAKKKKGAASRSTASDVKTLVGIDQPFDYQEVVEAAGPVYARHLSHEDLVMIPYEELKENVARLDAQVQKQAATVLEFPHEPAHKNILVIDDEVAVNNNIRKILKKKGYEVDQAVSKEEALAQINHGDHRVILLDLKIPGVKGLELLAAIGDKRPDARVIMITGYASIETAVEAARMGIVEYLPKPFTPAEIRTATEKAFRMAA